MIESAAPRAPARTRDGRSAEAPRHAALPLDGAGERFKLDGGPSAALLLHGLTGTPFEVRPIATVLHARGVRCVGPVLPGHGSTPAALRGVPWQAWVEAGERELGALAAAAGQPVLVVGCSMGALVACALAARRPAEVLGLALLAPALRLALPGRVAGALARLARGSPRLPSVPKLGSDVRDPDARRQNPTLPAIPLSSVAELLALARHVDAELPRVRCPALVVVGAHDHTVSNAGARRLARRIGSGPARVVELPQSFHLVGIDLERDRCAAEVARFHDGLTGRAAHGA